MNDLPKPPAQLEAIVEALGIDDAVAFILAFGGTELYIARAPTGENPIAKQFGLQKAQALSKVAGRIPPRIPLQKPFLAKYFCAKGLTNSEIARKLHVADHTVRRYLAGGPKRKPPELDQFQLDL